MALVPFEAISAGAEVSTQFLEIVVGRETIALSREAKYLRLSSALALFKILISLISGRTSPILELRWCPDKQKSKA